jgi:hypothetical protein
MASHSRSRTKSSPATWRRPGAVRCFAIIGQQSMNCRWRGEPGGRRAGRQDQCPGVDLARLHRQHAVWTNRNTWNPALTPGGSSGGAVAAVASGIGPIALGTDGGGSIRRPASHAGVVDRKPTPGRIPRCNGLPAILLDFEVIGPIARTIAGLVTVTAALSVPDARDPASRSVLVFAVPSSLPPRRILFVPRFGAHAVDREIAASVAAAVHLFAAMGHHVIEGEVPFDIEQAASIQTTISQTGLAWLRETKGTPSSPSLQVAAAAGASLPSASLFAALDATHNLRRSMSASFETTDLILRCRSALPKGRDPTAGHRWTGSWCAGSCGFHRFRQLRRLAGFGPSQRTVVRRFANRLSTCRRRDRMRRCSPWVRRMRPPFHGCIVGRPLSPEQALII